jgi:hypothetical protein
MNSSELEQRIRKSPVLRKICESNTDVPQLADAITLLILSRRVTPEEKDMYRSYMQQNNLSLNELAYDMMWIQINSNEFLYNH